MSRVGEQRRLQAAARCCALAPICSHEGSAARPARADIMNTTRIKGITIIPPRPRRRAPRAGARALNIIHSHEFRAAVHAQEGRLASLVVASIIFLTRLVHSTLE